MMCTPPSYPIVIVVIIKITGKMRTVFNFHGGSAETMIVIIVNSLINDQ